MSPGGQWKVIRPRLAMTSDRARIAPSRTDAGPVEEWFDEQVLLAGGLKGVSFDFFVNWNTRALSPPLLAKVAAVRSGAGGVVGASLPAVQQALCSFRDWGQSVYRLCDGRELEPLWAILPDWIDWTSGDGPILLCPIGSDGLPSSVERLRLGDVRKMIAEHTGQRFKVQKGLYWSTTPLEGFLSGTNTPWPGDADLVLVDSSSGAPLAVIEFRKQTQDRPLSSRFADYYPRVDGRRWDRLAVLAAHFEPRPPVVAIHYSVRDSERLVLVNRIEGEPGKLAEVSEVCLDVPTDPASRKNFTDQLLSVLYRRFST